MDRCFHGRRNGVVTREEWPRPSHRHRKDAAPQDLSSSAGCLTCLLVVHGVTGNCKHHLHFPCGSLKTQARRGAETISEIYAVDEQTSLRETTFVGVCGSGRLDQISFLGSLPRRAWSGGLHTELDHLASTTRRTIECFVSCRRSNQPGALPSAST